MFLAENSLVPLGYGHDGKRRTATVAEKIIHHHQQQREGQQVVHCHLQVVWFEVTALEGDMFHEWGSPIFNTGL